MSSCIRKTQRFLSIVKALISRGLFVLHGLICIWRVVVIKGDEYYWLLSATLPFMLIETIYTLCRKRNSEWKWICPSVVLYLGTAVPAIWFLELDVLNQRMLAVSRARSEAAAAAVVSKATAHGSTSGGSNNNNSNNSHVGDGQEYGHAGIVLPVQLGTAEWCKVLEQMLLLILIVGRWLLPKGEITREQLSQLLLVYIGMAADIIELFEAFKEERVSRNPHLITVILALWTASLAQFTLVVTATKSKKTRPALTRSLSSQSDTHSCCGKECCPTEVVSIIISVLLQDAPFLVLRLLLIFRYDVLSYTNIFFTSKNSLVLILQIYRLVVLFTESRQPPPASTQSTELLSSSPASSHFSSTLNLQGGHGTYESTMSYDQSSYSDGEYAKRQMALKTSGRDRRGSRHARSSRRGSSGHARHTRPGKDSERKHNQSKHKAKNRPVTMTTRSEVESMTPKSHNRKLPNTSPAKKSKQAERGLTSTQEAEVNSPGRQAKKSGQAGRSSHSGTPRASRKSSRREAQTISDTDLGRGQADLSTREMKLERQTKVFSSTTPPTDLSDDDRLAARTGQKSGSRGHHNTSFTKSPKQAGRLGRYSKEYFSPETRGELEEEMEDVIDGEILETAGYDGMNQATFDIEKDFASVDPIELELSAAGRRDTDTRKRKKGHWCSAKDLKTALTFLNEADGYKTVVLKSGKSGKEMLVFNDTD